MHRKHLINRIALARLCLVLLTGCAAESADDLDEASTKEDVAVDPSEGDLGEPTLTPPVGALVLRLDDGVPADATYEKGASCGGILNPCGIVYNRTRQTLQIARDASSHLYCKSPSHFRDLPPGADSNKIGSPRWPDVDCVRSRNGWMFTNGRFYPPNEWVRIWTSKWVY